MFELHEMISTAERLADEGVWVTKVGEVDGQKLVIVVAVGMGGTNLLESLRKVSFRDPRSTDEAKT